jgi:hypothetical protein
MSDFIPKSSTPNVRGLGPKAQKLQALREKAAKANDGSKAHAADGSSGNAKANAQGHKKASFNRKAV